MKTWVLVALGVAAIGLLLGVTSDVMDAFRGEPAPLDERLQRTLDRAVGRRGTMPGAVLYIESAETGVWTGASGLSDIDSEAAMLPGHRFCIGSITKTFVAVVILQLMEEGALDLDASMVTFVPENVSALFPASDRITVRMLLNHTSGIPEWLTEEARERLVDDLSYVWQLEELMRLSAEQQPYFEPGEGFFYSNTDYTLLGVIIEQITGEPWSEQVQKRILDPLALTGITIRSPGDSSLVSEMARGYSQVGQDLVDLTSADPSMAGAAGGNAMVSTAGDLASFLNALLNGKLFSSTATLDEMLVFVDAPDEQGVPYWYGLGLEKYLLNGMTLIGHGGGAVGYSTVMYVAPDEGITIVASSNASELGTAYLDLMVPALRELER
jgi:D-alanyl-D-alanine carboxypeptidase